MTTAQFFTVTRPSRSGGHAHVMTLDAETHLPIDLEHPCSCAAGAEGRFCWAVLETIVAQVPGSEAAAVAQQVLEQRRQQSVKKGRH